MKDQYPVLRIHGECYTMSLRMMKAVWYFKCWKDLLQEGAWGLTR